jgi:hypothetical protein
MQGTGNGYFDKVTELYVPTSSETWASYSTWSGFTTWEGTYADGTTLVYTSRIFDAGEINKTVILLSATTGLPFDTTISYGNTLSGSSIASPSTENVTAGQGAVPTLTGRYFQFTLTQTMDSANDTVPFLQTFDVTLQSASNIDTVSFGGANRLDTSTLSGSVGQRTYTDTSVGSYVDFFTQILSDNLTGTQTPVCYVDLSGTNPVLNIFDADAYGKRKRMDVTVNINYSFTVGTTADANGNIVRT